MDGQQIRTLSFEGMLKCTNFFHSEQTVAPATQGPPF